MRIISFLILIFFNSCKLSDSKKHEVSIKEWIVSNKEQISISSDSIIQDYLKQNKADSNWISSSIAITKFKPGVLGMLVKKVGDSTECIVIELRFYKDPKRKKSIMIAAVDSSCLHKIENIVLKTDSTDILIFGKKMEPLY
jgi:hypothetical protein